MKALVDVLAIGAHPDDVELGCGGLLLSLRGRGYRFGIIDVTAGERASRGTRDERRQEAKIAAELLGATARECLDLPDTLLEDTSAAARLMAGRIRKYRPKLIVSMHEGDEHPDHVATARITRRAAFLAALHNADVDGEPHRARQIITYSRHTYFRPSFVVDVGEFVDRKLEAVFAHRTQFTRDVDGAKTPISAPDFEEDVRAFMRFHGRNVGALYAEPFAMDGPPALPDPIAALCVEQRDVE